MIVGLTGGIGSGKTAVSSQLKKMGIKVVDSDQVSRDLVEAGSPALKKIVQHFGDSILLSNGSLDRAALRKLIFAQPSQKQWLENLLHPLVAATTDKKLATFSSPYVVLESPLLLETSQHKKTDFVVVVDAPENLQLERATKRDNNSQAQIKAIMNAQMPRAMRIQKANWVLENHEDINDLHKKVRQLHKHLCQLSETLP